MRLKLAAHRVLCVHSIVLVGLTFCNLALAQEHSIIDKSLLNTKKTYYVDPGSYGTRREMNPPSYSQTLSESGIHAFDKLDWLDFGLDYRCRSEIRNNDLRRPNITTDYPVLLRTRAYLGIKTILDPFRFAIEFEDSHRVNSQFGLDTKDFNRAELIQLFAGLHFENLLRKDPLGNTRPVYLNFGRQTFEFLDRRLIGLNRWRNTTNNFVGFRGTVGQDKNDWQMDLLALRPIERFYDKIDHRDTTRYFFAAIGHWRKWSDFLTIEPYYIALNQTPSVANNMQSRMIHSPGIRLYGWLKNGLLNYDFTQTQQFGNHHGLRQQAFMTTVEVGVKLKKVLWKPRISLFYGFASGDKNPNDEINNRFERFYGFARPWSPDDYIVPENISTPKIRFEIQPTKIIKADFGYAFYWLASSTDRFFNLFDGANNRDITGQSGKFLGHGFDARVQFTKIKFIDAYIGYAHFRNGEFVRNRQNHVLGASQAYSNFFYMELSISMVHLISSIHSNKQTKSILL